MSASASEPAGEPSYEVARAELAEVMKALESGGQSLEDSLELWRRGEELAEMCQRWLDDAGRRLDEAIAARSGAGTADTSGAGTAADTPGAGTADTSGAGIAGAQMSSTPEATS